MKALSWSQRTRKLVLVAGIVLALAGVLLLFMPFSTSSSSGDVRCPAVVTSATIETGEFVEMPDETFTVAKSWSGAEVYGYFSNCRGEGRTRLFLSGGTLLVGGALVLTSLFARKAEKTEEPKAPAST
jgi:drug/metabolite transporter (DMT)-like permease